MKTELRRVRTLKVDQTKSYEDGSPVYIPDGGIGYFHKWAVDYQEFDSGPGHHPVGIVEMENGEVKLLYPSFIQFMDRLEKEVTLEDILGS